MDHRGKLLLLLQFYDGDKTAAFDLAQLIADIEPAHSDAADLMFCARYDTAHDSDVVAYVSRKFNTYTHTATRRGKGWPIGPNCLFFDSMRHAITMIRDKKLPQYRAILAMESDDCPLAGDWISTLRQEMGIHKANVVGAFQFTPVPHINGNCLFNGDPEFLNWLYLNLNSPVNIGWDAALWPKFSAKGVADTKTIRSIWNMPDIDESTWDRFANEGCVLLHGVKGESARSIARKRLV